MKRLLLFLTICICVIDSYATDVIILKNSTRIDAVIEEVSSTQIKYKKASNPTGPTFVVDIQDVSTVMYGNGDVQVFTQQQNAQPQQPVQQPMQQQHAQQQQGYQQQSYQQYFPQGNGGYQFAQEKPKKEKSEKPKKPKKPLPPAFIGINAGFGATINPYIIYLNGALGFDWAVSANKKWAIGSYLEWAVYNGLSAGVQFVNGDYMNEQTCFVWGLGVAYCHRGEWHNNTHYMKQSEFTYNGTTIRRFVNYSDVPLGASIRLGFSTKKHFYMLFNFDFFPYFYANIYDSYQTTGDNWTYRKSEDRSWLSETATTATISFGYHFDVQPKRKSEKKQANTDL